MLLKSLRVFGITSIVFTMLIAVVPIPCFASAQAQVVQSDPCSVEAYVQPQIVQAYVQPQVVQAYVQPQVVQTYVAPAVATAQATVEAATVNLRPLQKLRIRRQQRVSKVQVAVPTIRAVQTTAYAQYQTSPTLATYSAPQPVEAACIGTGR